MEGAGVHKRTVRPQSFLRSSKARTLNHREIASLTDEQAFERFKAIRFAANQGEPFCPYCGCVAIYTYKSRPIFKCQGCEKQFSLTSGTAFAHRKMPISDILYAIAEFIEGVKGVSAMHLQRKLQCEYRTAWVLTHKLREAMSRDIGPEQLTGTVEFDGTLIGGYLKPRNAKKSNDAKSGRGRKAARVLPSNIGSKKLCVMVARERGASGRMRTTVLKHEAEGKPFISATVSRSSILHSDSASGFDDLVREYADYRRINHTLYYWTPESSTNFAENFFSMLKRGLKGVYHHIAHPSYAHAYSEEMAWRLTNKSRSNLAKFEALVRSVATPRTTQFRGMWRRKAAGREIALLC